MQNLNLEDAPKCLDLTAFDSEAALSQLLVFVDYLLQQDTTQLMWAASGFSSYGEFKNFKSSASSFFAGHDEFLERLGELERRV